MWFALGPPTPQFDYCISYSDGQPTLQVISHVCMYVAAYIPSTIQILSWEF